MVDAAVPAERRESAPDDDAARLLGIVGDVVRELHPGAPVAAVGLDAPIDSGLGLDSLSRVELVTRIEHGFGVRLAAERVSAARTPRDLLQALAAARGMPPPAADIVAPLPEAVTGTPQRARTLLEAWRWHLQHHPGREQLRIVDGARTLETWTYESLWNAAGRVARGLAAHGVEPGDTVALMLPTDGSFFEAFVGTLRHGAIPVPLYPPSRWSDIAAHVRARASILANARASLLVSVPEAQFIGRILRTEQPWLRHAVGVADLRGHGGSDRAAAARGSDIALIQYTSGSTGEPKGVVLTHEQLLANIRAMGVAAAASSNDRFVSWLPLYHDMGLIGAWLGTLYHAIPLVLMSPATFLARPATWLQAIHRHRATISAGPNFAYEIAASKIGDDDLEGIDLACWRLAFNGAEPVRAATLERFAARYARYGFDRRALTPVYGLAESAVGLAFPPLLRGPLVDRIDADRLRREARAVPLASGSPAPGLDVVGCGRPLPGHELRVVDDHGHELPGRCEGRVEFRGPSATSGYYRNPEATQRLRHGDWLDTGDVGYIASGELFLTSRAKDLIKRGGHAIHPYDLEAAIGEVGGIRRGCVAVFGTTDRARGTERVIVVAETTATDAAVRQALHATLAGIAANRLDGPADEILLVAPHTLLKTSSGKLRRAACRDLYERGQLTAARPAVWLQLAGLVAGAAVARLRHALRGIARSAWGIYAWTMLALVLLASLPPLLLLPGMRRRLRMARHAAALLVRICGIALHIEGREHLPGERPAVIVANHASYADALVLLAGLGVDAHFAAKRELARVPLLGWPLRRLGTHFVDRVDPAAGVEDVRELEAAVLRGEHVVVFAEGGFGRAPGLRAFHLGAFAASAATGVPVVPVALQGTRSLLRDTRWLPVRHPIGLSILAPEAPDGGDWAAAVRLRDRVRGAMLSRCGEPDLTR